MGTFTIPVMIALIATVILIIAAALYAAYLA